MTQQSQKWPSPGLSCIRKSVWYSGTPSGYLNSVPGGAFASTPHSFFHGVSRDIAGSTPCTTPHSTFDTPLCGESCALTGAGSSVGSGVIFCRTPFAANSVVGSNCQRVGSSAERMPLVLEEGAAPSQSPPEALWSRRRDFIVVDAYRG
eukprot:6176372-Pleurochrysis_carterae.AAC.1